MDNNNIRTSDVHQLKTTERCVPQTGFGLQ